MYILLLVTFFILIFIILLHMRNYFEAFLESFLITTLMILFITNILSIESILTDSTLKLVWGGADLILFFVLLKFRRAGIKVIKHGKVKFWSGGGQKFLVSICLVLLSVTFFLAVFTVTNCYDSMTYHMARIAEWIQNRSVNYYCTSNYRQLYSSVLGEYMMLHVYLLTGNDWLVNLVQWFSYAITGFTIMKICVKLKMKKTLSLTAAILFYTINLAIAESITTQVDLIGTCFLVIFIYYCIDLITVKELGTDRKSISTVIICALCVGFAYMSKNTACISMLVFLLVLLGVRILRKDKAGCIVSLFLVAAGTIGLVVCETFIRNFMMLGSIVPTEYISDRVVGTTDIRLIFLNGYKQFCNLLSNDWFTVNGMDPFNKFLMNLGYRMADFFRVNIDSISISTDNDPFRVGVTYSHDRTGAPFLMVLFTIVIVGSLIYMVKKRKELKMTLKGGLLNFVDKYTAVVIGLSGAVGFVITIFMCGWNYYATRWVLPSAAILCITVVAFIDLVVKHNREMKTILIAWTAAMLSISTIQANSVYAYDNIKTGLNNRNSLYFYNFRSIEEAYRASCNYILEKGYKEVGLLIGGDSYEYPVWKIFEGNDITMKQVFNIFEDQDFIPECMLAIYHDGIMGQETFGFHGATYKLSDEFQWDDPRFAVYERIDT